MMIFVLRWKLAGLKRCSICKTGTTHKGKTTCTIAYYSLETTNKIQLLVSEAVKKGAEIEVVRIAS
jgi:hypothetical protein